MNLEEKLRLLKPLPTRRVGGDGRGQPLDDLLRQAVRLRPAAARPTPPLRRGAKGRIEDINDLIDGRLVRNRRGEFFAAEQRLPFGRPYGRARIGDIASADFSTLKLLFEGQGGLPDVSRWVFLDTETTGLAGGAGTLAFLVGLGTVEGNGFRVRQFFLRDFPDEPAMLEELSEVLRSYEGIVTFNGKTFDLPLLENRFVLSRRRSPFRTLLHLDLLHPARRLWKLRLESCKLTHLEDRILGIRREGDIDGAEIPAVYFDYLRTGSARGLQGVFFHNALDIITLAALTVEMTEALGSDPWERVADGLDLFSLSRILERAGEAERSVETCRRALSAGLPSRVRTRALLQLASHLKRQRRFEEAVRIWLRLTRRAKPVAEAFEQLAMYSEHRQRDYVAALDLVRRFLQRNGKRPLPASVSSRFAHRLNRLERKTGLLLQEQAN